MSSGIAEIKNRPVVFTSTWFLGKNPLTRQTRGTFNCSRANLNGPIGNTFIVFCWNQSETILLQGSPQSHSQRPRSFWSATLGTRLGSPELLISLLYMRRRALGWDCRELTVSRTSNVRINISSNTWNGILLEIKRRDFFFNETAFLFWCHAQWKLGSSNCCIFEMKHDTGMETCTKIYFLFIFNLV